MIQIPPSSRLAWFTMAMHLLVSSTPAMAFSARHIIMRNHDYMLPLQRGKSLSSRWRNDNIDSYASSAAWHSPGRTSTNARVYLSTKSDVEDCSSNLQKTKMKILGVCGGIGSGKSTACKLMVESLGCAGRIDADLLAHGVYEPGCQAWKEIVSEFGEGILLSEDEDSKSPFRGIDRRKLGSIVFSDSQSMSKLEQIVWPHVRTKIEEKIEEIVRDYSSTSTYDTDEKFKADPALKDIIIVEAALLMETDWHDLLDGLWVVQASSSVAVKRLMDNRGLSEEEAMVRIRAQEKRRGIGSSSDGGDNGGICNKLRKEMEKGVVTAVIINDGTLDELKNALQNALNDPTSFKKVG